MTNEQTRALLKSFTWRIVGSIATTILAFSFGIPAKALGLLFFADLITKFILYYAHERLWQRLRTPFNNYLNNRKTR